MLSHIAFDLLKAIKRTKLFHNVPALLEIPKSHLVNKVADDCFFIYKEMKLNRKKVGALLA